MTPPPQESQDPSLRSSTAHAPVRAAAGTNEPTAPARLPLLAPARRVEFPSDSLAAPNEPIAPTDTQFQLQVSLYERSHRLQDAIRPKLPPPTSFTQNSMS